MISSNLSSKISNETIKRNETLDNILINTHPKQVLYYLDTANNQDIEKDKEYLYFYKITFSYKTNKGNDKEDIRLYILDKLVSKEDISELFFSKLMEFNEKYKYRAISDLFIKEVETSNISNFKTLSYIKNINNKDKKRILVNLSSKSCVVFHSIKVKYTTERGSIKKSNFILNLSGYGIKNKVTNKEISYLINQNKQRKVSNVKILDTHYLGFIKL